VPEAEQSQQDVVVSGVPDRVQFFRAAAAARTKCCSSSSSKNKVLLPLLLQAPQPTTKEPGLLSFL
jgi:hypothetical protein